MSAGCAQIGTPTGGPKDTTPPRLLKASPPPGTTNFKGNRITFTFDEYVNLQEVQNNFLASPLPKINPQVDFKLKTVTVKLKDSLLPNTTYTLNFGNAIRDNNENNPLKNFTYVFSTGNFIDSLRLTGNVILAETGRTDSTVAALLYRNLDDSAVRKTKPDYLSRLDGKGNFLFTNLAPGRYNVFALKDMDGGKTYNSKSEVFAFAGKPITVSANTAPVNLYAYAEEKPKKKIAEQVPVKNTNSLKKLSVTTAAVTQNQDLLDSLELLFSKPLKKFDTGKITLADTGFTKHIPFTARLDSNRKKLTLAVKWEEDKVYRLILDPAAFTDTSGNTLSRKDTLRFRTKKEADYGNLVLRFSHLDLTKHLVLQFVQGEDLRASYPLTSNEWSMKLFKPGEYDLRILFDSNNNGKWDPGDYTKKIQPEKVISLPDKLGIRANWDNERDIKLKE